MWRRESDQKICTSLPFLFSYDAERRNRANEGLRVMGE
jgi:hypothetical protein